MITRIDHVGIAVNSIEDAVKLYSDVLGLKNIMESNEVDKVKIATIPVGESMIELIEPTDSEAPIAKYIEQRGEGIHHLALGVSGIQDMLKIIKERGVPLIDVEPRIGIGGSRIAFLGTKTVIELVER